MCVRLLTPSGPSPLSPVVSWALGDRLGSRMVPYLEADPKKLKAPKKWASSCSIQYESSVARV